MNALREGNAIVYCQGAFGTTNGKTAHGLVRRSSRYLVVGIIDAAHSGQDAGAVLDGTACGIPIVAGLEDALSTSRRSGHRATHFVMGVAPDGGRLSTRMHRDVCDAIRAGLHVDSGLHDFLTEDPRIVDLADQHAVTLRDVRKPPPRDALHFFSGKIEQVTGLRVAVLGTDSALGKRTTAGVLVDAFAARGRNAQLVGTGQTAWLQGARYSICLDSLINDFVAGEIEHAVWSAWNDGADTIVIEGQGSLMNPAYPGGVELLAAARPDAVVLQHAPARREYDGFPGYPLHPLGHQIEAIELISGRPVVAISLNHENLTEEQLLAAKESIRRETGLPVCDALRDDVGVIVDAVERRRPQNPTTSTHTSSTPANWTRP